MKEKRKRNAYFFWRNLDGLEKPKVLEKEKYEKKRKCDGWVP
jgi:hypothetical protein